MRCLAKLLEIDAAQAGPRRVVAATGSGGKTTLLWRLAQSFRQERVLVSTSVKMWQPEDSQYDLQIGPEEARLLASAEPGITFAGTIMGNEGKIGALPPEVLERLFPLFDKSFIEADGSRRRPYKGWAEHEPVLPDDVDLTVAVIPAPAPGRTATDVFVHRLPLFLAISGAKAGEVIRPEHLAAVIAHPQGLLARTRGRAALFINQVENPEAEQAARAILALLPAGCLARLSCVLSGSARLNRGKILWRAPS